MDCSLVIGAVLVTETAVRVRDISAAGAQLETAIYLPLGTIGIIEVEFDGGSPSRMVPSVPHPHHPGVQRRAPAAAEFLPIAAPDQRSLRAAVRRFIARDAHLLIP